MRQFLLALAVLLLGSNSAVAASPVVLSTIPYTWPVSYDVVPLPAGIVQVDESFVLPGSGSWFLTLDVVGVNPPSAIFGTDVLSGALTGPVSMMLTLVDTHLSLSMVATSGTYTLSYMANSDIGGGIAITAATISPVPEPPAAALTLAGLFGLALYTRHRNRTS